MLNTSYPNITVAENDSTTEVYWFIILLQLFVLTMRERCKTGKDGFIKRDLKLFRNKGVSAAAVKRRHCGALEKRS